MSPIIERVLLQRQVKGNQPPVEPKAIVLEGWAEGFSLKTVIGGLVIMAGITVANMKKGVLLHKLILLELLLGGWQSFNLFWPMPVYGWWLSTAAVGLHMSTQLHSVIAWLKLKPFMTPRASRWFIGSVLLVQPYWVLEIYATFAYFNNINEHLFTHTRPVEAIFRDPWWVAACGKLLWIFKTHYEMTLREVITISPRFAVMLTAMALSIAFVVLDILSVIRVFPDGASVGVNPFWKLALVFKCCTDTVILDDFKTALDRLWMSRKATLGDLYHSHTQPSAHAGYAQQRMNKARSERGMQSNGESNASGSYTTHEDSLGPLVHPPHWEHFEMQSPARVVSERV
ncbi:hypothetical protein BD289DRAFT_371086 [Coniella lustricola]|uniref:Integral membrane protein n=1 Tax=Coniella lustricola TaxID=2025994 RepID=A0A2T3A446_9PEZI|nr:hypothetical protein BD289DRAFT_371086 [Coniella lustricola]